MFPKKKETKQLIAAIEHFLAEDVAGGDLTSEAIFSPTQSGSAVFIAREEFVVAGIETVAPLVFQSRNPAVRCRPVTDGTRAKAGDILLTVRGPVRDLLAAERVALNLCQRMSGIATLTARFVQAVAGLPVRILDTRKTTPGLRVLEKYAVTVGGGHNHRFTLYDQILIKDNHIAAAGSIGEAVRKVRDYAPKRRTIEVECETLAQVREALTAGVEIIMLDNMTPATMRKAVALVGKKATTEASGGVTLKNIRRIAETGVDCISIGALTHSAPAMDISMELVTT
ncbi:MAG TPA: carboxylating nicotinate-nucleotide diphosphorylase [Desulfurivibrionaceae bacterium]|nr:carboxylating nicotinate-nucleotide diphosphorylase [Desulfurivibrionaceae bacterium]